ncbi:multi-sensor signal transduction histidine kinase [Methanoregula boonei 6A8]|uniref:histidine kinase n=1 Tax=Methanoregula boonei (strain DSM 21154 / JCM 14090 / 6A8) TaxID=456442 RepID=A7I5Z7_METB6|nr:PAS domain S-box protein [Methanoregula boonei]ABS55158.1 multi-sensor signal transduction histidine kinase [Methanoregula boonei 6A8]
MISLLYVDDEPALLDLCRLFLEQEGDISVSTAGSVEEALARIAAGTFDAIISDYQMPEIDGITFLRTIRRQYPDMPFILFTGRGREEVVIEAINSGVDSYVQKGGDSRAQFKELSHLIRQIVRRRKAESGLRQMKFSVDHASEGIIWLRGSGEIAYFNEAICAMLGYTPREFSGLSVVDIRPGLSRQSLSSAWDRILSRKCASIEEMLLKKDGSTLPVELVLSYNEQGPDPLIFVFVRDISERRRSEESLKKAVCQLIQMEDDLHRQFEDLKKSDHAMREIGQRYQMLSAVSKDWIWEIDTDCRITYSGPQVQALLGFDPAALAGKCFSDLLVPACALWASSELSGLMAKKEVFHSLIVRALHREGREVLLALTGIPLHSAEGTFCGFYGIARDVSEEKTPDILLPSRTLLEQAGDAIFVTDVQTGVIIDANRNALNLVNRTLPEVCALQESALYSSPRSGQTDEPLRLRDNDEQGTSEEVLVDKEGNPIPVIVSTRVLQVGDRRIRIGIYHDISDLRSIESALREKAGELDRFFASGPDMFCILNTDGRIVRLNPAGEALLGCTTGPGAEHSLPELLHPDDRADLHYLLMHMGSGGKASTFVNRVVQPDGSSRWLEWRAFLSEKNQIYAIARDFTGQKRAEQALALANRKLSLLTDLTRHDIRNKLAVLTGYLDLFRSCPAEPYFSLYTEKINETVAAITAQLEFIRIYQKLGSAEPAWFNVNQVFSGACRQREIPAVIVSSSPDSWEIFADPLIDRVFSTLVDNAFRYGATLTKIQRSAHESPEGLVVVIEDNGIGIAQEKKEQIFEKEAGKACGQTHSLFLAREILSITGITLRETGRAGKGARFEMQVPKGMYRLREPEPDQKDMPVFAPDFITPPRHNHTL